MSIGDRQITADRIVERLRAAGITVEQLDGIADVNKLYAALKEVDPVPPSPIDELCAALDAGDVDPKTLPDRVHATASHMIDRQTWSAVRVPVAERIGTQMLACLRTNLASIHEQLSASFATEAARLSDAVGALGDVNDAGTALDRGLEASWRDVQTAAARLETIGDAVRTLPDIGHGTHGNHALWFVPIAHLDDVDALPLEKPTDPLGRFVGWLRNGHELELADGAGKTARDQHARDIKTAAHNPFTKGPIATPRARADAEKFQRGAPVINRA